MSSKAPIYLLFGVAAGAVAVALSRSNNQSKNHDDQKEQPPPKTTKNSPPKGVGSWSREVYSAKIDVTDPPLQVVGWVCVPDANRGVGFCKDAAIVGRKATNKLMRFEIIKFPIPSDGWYKLVSDITVRQMNECAWVTTEITAEVLGGKLYISDRSDEFENCAENEWSSKIPTDAVPDHIDVDVPLSPMWRQVGEEIVMYIHLPRRYRSLATSYEGIHAPAAIKGEVAILK